MNFIDELLKDEKVEWKKLGEVCEIKTGQPVSKNMISNNNGIYPVINSGREPLGYINTWNTEDDPIGITTRGAGVGSITYQIGKYFRGNLNYSVTIKNSKILNVRFLYHILLKSQNSIYKLCTFNGIPALNSSELKKLVLPIPSLETQEKIVKILDSYTKYITELQEKLKIELQARNKQYNYYRDMLLSENYLNKISEKLESRIKYEISCIELEKIIKIKNGKDWKSLGKGNIPVYGSGGKMGVFVDKYSYNKPTVLIPRKGSIENIFYLEEPFWNVDTIFYTEINEKKILSKYFYYFMQNYNIKSLSTDSTRPSITQSTLNKLKILLPPIEIQNKIVKILDRFQELLSDTKGLLPLEIERRRKQYEYYREKLLTFDKEEGYALSTAQHSTAQHSTAQQEITSNFFELLKEAAKIADIDINDKVEWKTLNEVTDIILGGTPNKNRNEYWDNGTIPWMSSGEVNKKKIFNTDTFITQKGYDNSSATIVPANSTVIALAGQGKTRGLVARIKIKLSTNQSLATLIPKENLNNDYLYYYLEGQYSKLRRVSSGNGSRGGLNKEILKKYSILIPSLSVQEYIVSILDKFDTLVNDLSQGLPKEIALRQKQYEYYREKLLNFEK